MTTTYQQNDRKGAMIYLQGLMLAGLAYVLTVLLFL